MRRAVLAWGVGVVGVLAVGLALAAPPGMPGSAGGALAIDGHRTVRGEVTKINEVRGTMTLKTSEGDVELQLPPAAVKGVRKGDRLTLRVGVHAPSGAGSPRTGAPARGVTGAKSP